ANKLVQVVYPVADLVIPIESAEATGPVSPIPLIAAAQPAVPAPPFAPGALVTATSGPARETRPSETCAGQEAAKKTIEDQLMRLVTTTIAADSWECVGGRGKVAYHPLGMALVVNQTQDVQEQIADLLAALRRLQEVEVAVEARLVSLSDAFFE